MNIFSYYKVELQSHTFLGNIYKLNFYLNRRFVYGKSIVNSKVKCEFTSHYAIISVLQGTFLWNKCQLVLYTLDHRITKVAKTL